VNRNIRSIGLGLVIATSVASRSGAQQSLRDMIIWDSLTPAKAQLRDFVAQLRDTLNTVQALHASITRNLATGVTSVVLSNGRMLGKRCRASAAMSELTTNRVAPMKTSDPRGDQVLAAFRAGLAALTEELKTCQHDDSVTMAASTPDQKRIEQVATVARDAVARYDVIRDALMKLLNIDLPIQGTMQPHRN
jgi:hypothetical protein